MSERTSFMGIPVEGEKTRGVTPRRAQRPVEELEPLLMAVLHDPLITEVGWYQYTPYFNDGEPCEFSVHTIWFRTTQDPQKAASDEDEEDEEEELWQLELDYHPVLAHREWSHEHRSYVNRPLSPEVRETSLRCQALHDALDGGEFEDVILETFGDHAMVTAKPTGFTIDFYQHD